MGGVVPKALEIIWLILAVICLGLGIHSTIGKGLNESYMFFILTLVALLMFALRRYRRKSLSSNQSG